VLDNSKEKIDSEAKFCCFQGDISEENVVELLKAVSEGKITLEQIQATKLKLDTRIKATAAQLLNCKTFNKIQNKYKVATFNKHRRQSFFPAFTKQKQVKGKRQRKENVIAIVLETFTKYVELVRQMTTSIIPRL